MPGIGTYAFINAKVRAMRSDLLDRQDYTRFSDAKSVRELIGMLAETRWASLTNRVDIQDAGLLEREIFVEEMGRIQNLYRRSQGPVADFLGKLLMRYDAERLKLVLRAWYRPQSGEMHLIHKTALNALPIDRILHASNLPEIVLLLQGTPFFKCLSEMTGLFQERKSLFPLELAIDRFVFATLLDAIKHLPSQDLRIATKLIGLEIDIKNLGWMSRFKTYYHLSTAEISDLLLPKGYRLKSDSLKAIASSENMSQSLADSLRGLRIHLPKGMEGELSFKQLEMLLDQTLYMESVKTFASFPFSIGAVLAYAYCIRFEARNLRTLLQAKAYDMPAEDIQPLIIV